MFQSQFESAIIEFTVYSRNWFFRNWVIGKTSLQLEYVNKRKNKLYARALLPLRRDDDPLITGMLDISVFVLKPGEAAPSRTLQMTPSIEDEDRAEGDKDDDLADLGKAMLSGDIDTGNILKYHVYIYIHKVEELPFLENGYKPSPFLTVDFVGCQVKTQVAPETQQFAFQAGIRIPVMTPLAEDKIVVKLWHNNYFSSDQLLAQGFFSFRQMRNNGLPTQWFCLYGWDPAECPDIESIVRSGESAETNFYKGKIMISGRVEKLDPEEELQPAGPCKSTMSDEPPIRQLAILADVYRVTGAEGRSVRVEISFGPERESTIHKAAMWDGVQEIREMQQETKDDDLPSESQESAEQIEDLSTFHFEPKEGRIEGILILASEDQRSRPKVMINVYSQPYNPLASECRIGFSKHDLHEFPQYEAGNPSRPKWYSLKGMPWNGASRIPPSVLIAIEQHHTSDLVRQNRKHVKSYSYILRAYCFLARSIERRGDEAPRYCLRVTCAGLSKTTKEISNVRPTWMECLSVKIVLYSDTPKTAPSMEPITVSLVERGIFRFDYDIGKAICEYTYMRRQNNLGEWEPYKLQPQWIEVHGGQYGTKKVGEVLIAFEMLSWKNREKAALEAKDMWPFYDPENERPREYNSVAHLCRIRRATLHFSLYGLRDLLPLPQINTLNLGSADVTKPRVVVEVDRFVNPAVQTGGKFNMEFKHRDTVEGEDGKTKETLLQIWKSKLNAASNPVEAKNFEFMQVNTLQIEIPDNMILEPFVRVKVLEEPNKYMLLGEVFEATLVGESLQSLKDLLPCCWYDGVDIDGDYESQKMYIHEQQERALEVSKVRPKFEEETDDQRALLVEEEQQAIVKVEPGVALIQEEQKAPQQVDESALPLQLRTDVATKNRRPLKITPIEEINVQLEPTAPQREGAPKKNADSAGRPCIMGRLENSVDFTFTHDFWYKSVPLLRNSDIIDKNDNDIDWHTQPGRTFGFIKCAFKLTDGWETKKDDDEEPSSQMAVVQNIHSAMSQTFEEEADVPSRELLSRSLNFDKTLDSYAFDAKKMAERFKSPQKLPARIRVRVYLLRAVCIYGRGHGIADPYYEFQLGPSYHLTTRNAAHPDTTTPEFFSTDEKDVQFPQESRLEISIRDVDDMGLGRDTLIGSTVIDLEDRWHSPKWKEIIQSRKVMPSEVRSLYTPAEPGTNRGSLEMWVEMVESSLASDFVPSANQAPPDSLIEVRIVVWEAKDVKVSDPENGIALVVGCQLNCTPVECYLGHAPIYQVTDEHFGSTGTAVYEWRVVYPRIKTPVYTCQVAFSLEEYSVLGNTPMGTFQLDLQRHVERVARDLDALETDKSWLTFHHGTGQEAQIVGELLISMTIMTAPEAIEKPAGLGREEPNQLPTLRTPQEGRGWGNYLSSFGFSLPSLGMWKKFIPLIVIAVAFLAALVLMRYIGLL